MTEPARSDDHWTVGRLLQWTTDYFGKKQPDSPRLDAEVLLSHVLGCARIQLYALYDAEVAPSDRAKFRELVLQRAAGCPVAYLVGDKEFYSLTFEVDRAVLIPRPETEHLVGEALAFAKKNSVERFLDVGVGSGAIAVTLAVHWPASHGLAVDRSKEALAVAQKNAVKHGVSDRLEFRESNLFSAIRADEQFDVVVSNPPYVTEADWAALSPGVRDYEPPLALRAGADGLAVVRPLIDAAPRFLRPGGLLLLEIGSAQETAVRALLSASPALELLPTVRDAARLPRVLKAVRKN
jgi:release factor glutamine methyltransferase